MTAPSPPVLDWRAVLVAGAWALYGIKVTAEWAAPTGCCLGEVDCPDGHVYVAETAAQPAVWGEDGRPA